MIPAATKTARARVDAHSASDRIFYSGMAIAMATTVFAGFAPTYYLRAVWGAPATLTGVGTLTALTQIHGAVFTAWVLLFVLQTAFIARRQVALHRRVGIGGAVLAAAMVMVGLSTAIAAARRGSAPPGIDALTFLVVPIFDLILFSGFIAAAVRARRDKEAHKRLMLLAYTSIIVAATARLPGVLPYGPFAFFALAFVFVLIGAGYDLLSRGRIHRVYLWGGTVLAISVPLRLAIAQTSAWQTFAQFLVR